MRIKVIAFGRASSLLAATDLSSKVTDPDGDLAFEVVRSNVYRTRDIVVDGDDGELVS